MKIYKNYRITIDLENVEEITRLSNLIINGLEFAKSPKCYLSDATKAFGKQLLDVLKWYSESTNEEGTNNEND